MIYFNASLISEAIIIYAEETKNFQISIRYTIASIYTQVSKISGYRYISGSVSLPSPDTEFVRMSLPTVVVPVPVRNGRVYTAEANDDQNISGTPCPVLCVTPDGVQILYDVLQ